MHHHGHGGHRHGIGPIGFFGFFGLFGGGLQAKLRKAIAAVPLPRPLPELLNGQYKCSECFKSKGFSRDSVCPHCDKMTSGSHFGPTK